MKKQSSHNKSAAVGGGAEGARRATGAEPPTAAGKAGRWSARRKADVVLRLLRGESLQQVSREVRVAIPTLEAWRQEFLNAGMEGMKTRPPTGEGQELRRAKAKIGDLTMQVELLEHLLEKGGAIPRRGKKSP